MSFCGRESIRIWKQRPSGTYLLGGTEFPFTPSTGNVFASFLLGTVRAG